MRKRTKNTLSFLLVLLMTISQTPASVAFAVDDDSMVSTEQRMLIDETQQSTVDEEEDVPEDGTDSEQGETDSIAEDETPQSTVDEEEDVPEVEDGADSEQAESDSTIVVDYQVFLSALIQLEQYADEYAREHSSEDAVALVINYIRTGVEKYNSGTWNTFCGEEKTQFTAFVSEQDAQNGTNANCLRNLGTFVLPNGDDVEFAHMFGCIDMAYHTGNQATADLGSWAGDLCDLLQLSQNYGVTGTVEEMAEQIRTDHEHLFLFDNPNAHSFGQRDLYGDLDAFYILNNLGGSKKISDIMRGYFTSNLNDSFRATYFLENRLGGVKTKVDIRNKVFDIYSNNEGIRTLEGTYLENGVNADIRKACCYAFADYLYETAYDRLINPYYSVFSSESSVIAPGVTQEIKMAMSADNKQMAYYIATADVTRNDVSVYANYGDNDGSVWKMARVSDQLAAAQKKHSNPDDEENYIPNYNAVASVNADFYNMSNGAVSGTLVMNGVHYGEAPQNGNNFFAILKDGTPVIAPNRQWAEYKDQVQEAVGGSIYLVKDGKIATASTSDYYTTRASRTCVGITYDGKVVLMVLDGRQEPYSCGGANAEIAQIMLDAGCITAINLDGGGSSTYVAKQEGSDTATVVNRPSDGYERSVSSSLLVVSTAKPSNVFDHAVVSADYDYLTVGTELELEARGVTATGGAVDLPEGAELQVSDPSIGSIEGNVFTASALGDVQVQVLSEEGEILGGKTLHVVVPEEIVFSRDTLNVVYGVPETLPLEATLEGKPVKINPSDVQFGFLKITLQSIGNVEGGEINTTRTQLVFDYPEAGTISGFDFIGNEDGGLRTLTVGAVLKNKLPEFQETINSAYADAMREARANGYSNDQAKLIAEEAAVNTALETAARTKIYLYSEDEATFNFDEETGNTGLLHWKREVSNSRYQREINMYYIQDPDEPMVTSYTFAVDMSKMPIPEKLTGLLYMLPGGDQEGRTAWSFLLQLAERISPLTTVTVDIHVPDGFDVDYSNLKLVNEYFDLTSASFKNSTLTIVGNFKLQTEPINPTTANPLCVVSGIKFIPTDAAAWDAEEPNQLNVQITGELNYDIYAHFHVLKSLASQEEYQTNYGLFPYDNSANIAQDYGAHFSSETDQPITFDDQFRLNREIRSGWVYEQGVWSYYQDGAKLTGVQELPSYEDGEEGLFWYDLGDDGISKGKLNGIFERDGDLYYATLGKLNPGWRSIENDAGESVYYYFSPATGAAVDGVQTINGHEYTFTDRVLTKGSISKTANGNLYYWAGGILKAQWINHDGNYYYARYQKGYFYTGLKKLPTIEDASVKKTYLFDDEGRWMQEYTGLYDDAEDNTYYIKDGVMVPHAGLVEVDGYYYYINSSNTAVKNRTYWVTVDNGLVKNKKYNFDEQGRMVDPPTITPTPEVKDGFYEENGELHYYINGALQKDKGLIEVNGDYYYIRWTGEVVRNRSYWVTNNNGIVPEGKYIFDADGKMVS